jgi:hypothetical protein
MTAHDEERVLSIAREVWKKSAPSDERTEMAARRIARRMRIGNVRTQRRPLAILAFATVLIGALAYAASGGISNESGPSRKVERPTNEATGQGQGAPATDKDKTNRSGAATVAAPNPPAPEPALPKAAPSAPAKPKKANEIDSAAAAASSWREVDDALGAKDDTRAEKALSGLAGSKDPTTQAKAKLGLAQLARSKNDCEKASSLAEQVIATPDVDPAVVKRAQAILTACR